MAIDLVAVLRLDDQISQSLKKVALGATAGFAAITAGAVASVKTFIDVESELKRTSALVGASSAEYNMLEQAAIDLGGSTTKSMSEITQSFSELGASGFEVNEIIGAMPGIIKASEASGESLATAASVVSSSLNIWGLEAEKASQVADILTMSANVSAAGIDSLGEALKYAGAPAAALGMDLAEISAAIGVMVDSGIDGSSAGTALRASLLMLNNPAKAQEKIMSKLGFSIKDASGEAKSLVDIVANMTDATKDMTAADRLATVGKLVGTEAASGFLALMSRGPDELAKMTDALRNSSGIAKETADKMNESLGASFKAIKSMVEATAYQIGKALAPAVSRVVKAMQKIDVTPMKNIASAVGTTLANAFDKVADNWSTLGPIIKPIVSLMGGFVAILGLIGGGAAAFIALSTVIGFLTGPIALVARAITLIGAGFVYAYKQFKPFKDLVQSGFQKISDFITTFKQSMEGGLFTGILNRDKTAVTLALAVADAVKKVGTQFQKVKDFFVTTKQILSGGLLTGILDRDQDAVAKAVGFANGLKTAFSNIKEFISKKITQLQPSFETLKGVFTQVRDTAVEVFPSLWSVIEPILSNVWSVIKKVADIATLAFNLIIVPALAYVGAAFQTVWAILGPILEFIGAAIEVAFSVLQIVWDTIIAPFATFLMGGFAEAINFVIPIIEGIGSVFETIGGWISKAAELLSGFADNLKSIKVPDWVGKIGSGAMNFASNIFGGGKKDGSHFNGIGRIPFDNYLASLHAGERVLNRFEADQYDAILGGEMQVAGVSDFKYEPGNVSNTTINNSTMNNNAKSTQGESSITIAKLADQINVREEADIRKIADALVDGILEKRGVTV